MEIRKVSIGQLNPALYNPRKDLLPEDTEYQKLERSIEEFGYIDPIIWNETTGNVLGGHQRLKILIAKGFEEVDVSVVHMDEVTEKSANIALNKISGEWDEDKLEELLQELSETMEDISMTGFDETEIEKIINVAAEVISANSEVQTENFGDNRFSCQCPKCGFMFNIKK